MTQWTLPSFVHQYEEEGAEGTHVAWDDSTNFRGILHRGTGFIKTSRDLSHLSRSPKVDITMKTWYLLATGFYFYDLPPFLSGIELKLSSNRRGRITDDTVQLWLSGELIGENRATLDLSPQKIYGGETDIWGTELTIDNLQDPSFGILVRFQSHPHWPHKDSAFLDGLELKIY